MTDANYYQANQLQISPLIKTLAALRQLSIRRTSIQQQHTQLTQKLIPTLQTILHHGGNAKLYVKRSQLQNSILNLVAQQKQIEAQQSQMTNSIINEARDYTQGVPAAIDRSIQLNDNIKATIVSPSFSA